MDLLKLDERQKFIEQTQKERKERELARVHTHLITNLNALIRGYLVRKQFTLDRRKEFSDLINAQSTPSNKELLKCSSSAFNILVRRNGDLNVFLSIIRSLSSAIQSNSKTNSFAALFLSVDYIHAATKLCADLVRYIPAVLADEKLDTHSSVKAACVYVDFIELYSDPAKWTLVAENKSILPVLNSLCAKIIAPLAEAECFENLIKSLNNGLKGTKTALPNSTLNSMFVIMFRIYKRQNFDGDSMQKFVFEFLSLPALTQILTAESFQLLKNESILSKVIQCIRSNTAKIAEISGINCLNLTANFVHWTFLEQDVVVENLASCTSALNALLLRCQNSANTGTAYRRNNWHHPILGWICEKIDDGTQGTFSRIRIQLENLWSQKMINLLFGQVLCFDEGKDSVTETKSSEILPVEIMSRILKKFNIYSESTNKELPPVSIAAVVCQLYQNALLSFSNSHIDILSGLCRDDRILRQLWKFVNHPECGGMSNYTFFLIADPSVTLPHFAPLHLFADIAFSLISILDEREMYESGSPFTIDQLCEIAKFVNMFCFKCIYDGLIDFESHRPNAFYQSIHQLCSILHNRDCRKPFTPSPSFWTVPEIKPVQLIADFEKCTPRAISVIRRMPHVVPLHDRMVLFRKLIANEKKVSASSCTVITVERSRIVEDGYRQLAALSSQSLRSTIRVKFINQQGLDEAGIDQDGVFKEFLELTLKKVFDPELNLFKSSAEQLLYPSPTSSIHENHLALFQFVGRMLAKSVYEGICVDVQLAPVLLATVLGKQLCPFDELSTLDPELYKNLTFVKHYEGDVSDMCLHFLAEEDFLGKVQTIELIPGGSEVPVVNDNKIIYIHRMAQFRVIKQTKKQCDNFVAGFRSIINPKYLSLFSTHELQYVISGQTSDIDVDDLRRNTQYYGGFHSNHRVIKWLWQILEKDFTAEERHLFLKFGTSCSRPPLLGFAYLEPSFSIRCVETSDDMDQGDTLGSVIRGFLAIKRKQPMTRLPTASTCFNLLKLPNYGKKAVLLEKLRYAIHADTGFELS